MPDFARDFVFHRNPLPVIRSSSKLCLVPGSNLGLNGGVLLALMRSVHEDIIYPKNAAKLGLAAGCASCLTVT